MKQRILYYKNQCAVSVIVAINYCYTQPSYQASNPLSLQRSEKREILGLLSVLELTTQASFPPELERVTCDVSKHNPDP